MQARRSRVTHQERPTKPPSVPLKGSPGRRASDNRGHPDSPGTRNHRDSGTKRDDDVINVADDVINVADDVISVKDE
jgi:hypothetical protein